MTKVKDLEKLKFEVSQEIGKNEKDEYKSNRKKSKINENTSSI